MPQQIIKNAEGNRAVIISQNPNGGIFTSCFYVNARSENTCDWTITSTRKTHSTEAGAARWANKQLAA